MCNSGKQKKSYEKKINKQKVKDDFSSLLIPVIGNPGIWGFAVVN
jgi:hypothetical protein